LPYIDVPELNLPLAHAGHWLAQVLYVVPVIAVVGWIAIRALLDRRRRP
jgi:hypothetical protein